MPASLIDLAQVERTLGMLYEIRALAVLLEPHLGRFHPGKSPVIRILDRTGTVIGRTGILGGASVDE